MGSDFQLTPEMQAYFNKLINLPGISNNQSAAMPSINPQEMQTPQVNPQQIQSPLNSEVNTQLMQDFADWRKKTKDFPQPYDPKTGQNPEYKPSKLRSILGNVAGGLTGIATLNPSIGMQTADTIKQQPYKSALQRYATSITPYEERMKQEASLAGISAKNFYDFLRAQSSMNTSNAALENAKTRRIESRKPTIGAAHAVVEPGQIQATEMQPVTSFNPESGQWEIADRKLGMSPTETPGERVNALNFREDQANQRALQGRLNAIDLANIRELNERDRLRITIASQLRGDLNPSEQTNILNQVMLTHPDLFVWADKTGKTYSNKIPGTTAIIKKGKEAEYQLALETETKKRLIETNDPRARILDLLEKRSREKNPLIVGEKDVE